MTTDKKIEDYLPLYLGCQCTWSGGVHTILGMEGNAIFIHGSIEGRQVVNAKNVRLILRDLSDMSEEEEFEWSENGHKEADPMMAEAEATKYLLSKHFDLFNLIPEGLAIDAKTLK